MKKKYFTIYEKGLAYHYLKEGGQYTRVKYHSHKPKDRSYRMIENLQRAKIKEFYRKEYSLRW